MKDFKDNFANNSSFPDIKRVVHFILVLDFTAMCLTEDDSESLSSIIILFFLKFIESAIWSLID